MQENTAGPRREGVKDRLLAWAFVAWLLGSALAAYQVGAVPVEWMSRLLVVAVAFVVLANGKVPYVPGSAPLVLLLCWALVLAAFHVVIPGTAHRMPADATTSYPVFVALRFTKLLSFIAALYLTYAMLRRGGWDTVVRWTTRLGTFMALAAIYIYIAQTHGLPEPPRTRIGTAGEPQRTIFTGTYAFHRAMGTFREPGDLAEWLVVPLFASLAYRRGRPNLHTLLIASALLLTGSLAGIVGSGMGLVGAVLLANPFRARIARTVLGVGAVGLLGLAAFSAVAFGYKGGETDLVGLLGERLAPFLGGGGIMETDRGATLKVVLAMPLPVFGYGLGDANLEFGRIFRLTQKGGLPGVDAVASFLSLYVNAFFATGALGLLLLLAFLLRPMGRLFASRRLRRDKVVLPLNAAYVTYLILFLFRAEELPLTFAVLYALLTYALVSNVRGVPLKTSCDCPKPRESNGQSCQLTVDS